MIKVILFDFFGVICQDIGWAWFGKSVKERGTEKRQFFKNLLERYDTGKISREELHKEMATLGGSSPEIVAKELESATVINQGVVTLLAILSQKYRIGLLSNSSALMVRDILADNNLMAYFTVLTISSEVGCLKPSKEIFTIALEKLGAKPQEVVFIDDRQEHVEGALALGIDSILFTGDAELKAELTKRHLLE